MTVFQFLTHTSGIRGEIYSATGGTQFKTLREAVDAIGAKGPDTPPGAEYFYSDTGTSALGALVEERAGMPVEYFFRNPILKPLGMSYSFLVGRPRKFSAATRRLRLPSAVRRPMDTILEQHDAAHRAILSSIRLYSKVLDYASFMAAIMGQGRVCDVRLLTPQSVEFALQPHSPSFQRTDGRRWSSSMGLTGSY